MSLRGKKSRVPREGNLLIAYAVDCFWLRSRNDSFDLIALRMSILLPNGNTVENRYNPYSATDASVISSVLSFPNSCSKPCSALDPFGILGTTVLPEIPAAASFFSPERGPSFGLRLWSSDSLEAFYFFSVPRAGIAYLRQFAFKQWHNASGGSDIVIVTQTGVSNGVINILCTL